MPSSVWNGRSVDGSVNEYDFPVVAGFLEESRVHADSFVDSIIDGIRESSPRSVAPGSGRDVMDAHVSFRRRGHLSVDEIQGEHFTGQLVPVFIHPQNVVRKDFFEIA